MTMTTIKHAICATLGLAISASPAVADEGETIGAIKERGELVCGTSTGTAIGLSTLDDSGKWTGLEVDYCRAVAAALLGAADKVRFVPLEFKNAFAPLQSGKIALLSCSATAPSLRDTTPKYNWLGFRHDA